jgi:hypothetical protein
LQVIIWNSLLKKLHPRFTLWRTQNLKDELPNYYFHLVKELIRKNHNSRYIENFGHQNPSKKSSLVSMLLHHITIDSFTH